MLEDDDDDDDDDDGDDDEGDHNYANNDKKARIVPTMIKRPELLLTAYRLISKDAG